MRGRPRGQSGARGASREELAALLDSSELEILLAAIENPLLTEKTLCEFLERKDLPAEILAQIIKKKEWMKSYPVRLRLARHPRTPRLATLGLLRQLFLFDLVGVSLNRLKQLPLGQKLTLARRGPTRVAAALAAEGLPQVLPLALDNAFLNEGQLLKMLAKADLPPRVVAAIANHRKWSYNANVRIALVRNPLTPLARVMTFLPDISLNHLRDLSKVPTLRADLKKYLEHEVDRRLGRKPR